MLVAFLLFATQTTVDYETVAKPLSAVLADLSTTTGTQLRASKALENELLVMSVRGTDVATLRQKMAAALIGKWSEKDNVFTIQSDEIEARKRGAATQKLIIDAMIEGRGPRIPARLPAYDQKTIEKWATAFAEPRAGAYLCEVALQHLDLAELLSIPFGERRIYSTRPNRWQLPVEGMAEELDAALSFHNDVAAKAAVANVNEPAAGTPQYESRQKLISKWSAPLKVLVIAERDQNSIILMTMVVDGDGKTLRHQSEFLPIWLPKSQLGIPPNTAKPITLSKAAKALSDLMSVRGKAAAADGRFVIDADSLDKLRSPFKYDPLSLHFSEQLIGLARNAKWNIVAHVRDEMVGMTMVENPTTDSVVQGLLTSPTTSYELRDSWLCISLVSLNDQRQIDRPALQALLDSTKSKAAGISELGKVASTCPDPGTTPLMVPYLHIAHASSYGGRMWYDLRFYHSLPVNAKEAATKNGSISIGQMGPIEARNLHQWVFYTRGPDFSLNGTVNYFGEIRKADEEPTEVMANGVPAGAILRFVRETEFGLLTAPSSPNALNGSPFSIRTVTFFKAIDPSEYEDTPPPQFEKFWIGDHTITRLVLQPNATYVLRGALVDWRIDLDGDPVTLSTAPRAFQQAYDKALRDAIARRGGGE
jgi:hypothetical protein